MDRERCEDVSLATLAVPDPLSNGRFVRPGVEPTHEEVPDSGCHCKFNWFSLVVCGPDSDDTVAVALGYLLNSPRCPPVDVVRGFTGVNPIVIHD